MLVEINKTQLFHVFLTNTKNSCFLNEGYGKICKMFKIVFFFIFTKSNRLVTGSDPARGNNSRKILPEPTKAFFNRFFIIFFIINGYIFLVCGIGNSLLKQKLKQRNYWWCINMQKILFNKLAVSKINKGALIIKRITDATQNFILKM